MARDPDPRYSAMFHQIERRRGVGMRNEIAAAMRPGCDLEDRVIPNNLRQQPGLVEEGEKTSLNLTPYALNIGKCS